MSTDYNEGERRILSMRISEIQESHARELEPYFRRMAGLMPPPRITIAIESASLETLERLRGMAGGDMPEITYEIARRKGGSVPQTWVDECTKPVDWVAVAALDVTEMQKRRFSGFDLGEEVPAANMTPVGRAMAALVGTKGTVVKGPEPLDAEPPKPLFELRPCDVKTDVYYKQGTGSGFAFKSASAVRLTHTPTGLTAESEDERTQHANRQTAWDRLTAKVNEEMGTACLMTCAPEDFQAGDVVHYAGDFYTVIENRGKFGYVRELGEGGETVKFYWRFDGETVRKATRAEMEALSLQGGAAQSK